MRVGFLVSGHTGSHVAHNGHPDTCCCNGCSLAPIARRWVYEDCARTTVSACSIPVRVPPYKILSIVLCKQSVICALQDVCSVVLYGAPDGVKPKTIGSLSRVSRTTLAAHGSQRACVHAGSLKRGFLKARQLGLATTGSTASNALVLAGRPAAAAGAVGRTQDVLARPSRGFTAGHCKFAARCPASFDTLSLGAGPAAVAGAVGWTQDILARPSRGFGGSDLLDSGGCDLLDSTAGHCKLAARCPASFDTLPLVAGPAAVAGAV